MPVRGLIVVLVLISALAAGWYFLVHQDVLQLNGTTVSKEITPSNPMNVPPDGQIAPAFSAARVGGSGEAVISGRGEPGTNVSVLHDGQVVGQAAVSPRGDWTVVIDQPLAQGSQELGLRAERPGSSLMSDDTMIIHTALGGGTPLVLDTGYGRPSRYLQRPDDLPAGDLSLDSVDTDTGGGVYLSGHASAGSGVRLYLDNQPLGDAQADNTGFWVFHPADIAAGAYTLRVDQLGPKSLVVARMEAPIERGDVFSVAHALLGDDQTLVVQPGDSLWRIARQIPDKGYQYTVLYRAAQDQLRDPNIVYPGQVFEPVEAHKAP